MLKFHAEKHEGDTNTKNKKDNFSQLHFQYLLSDLTEWNPIVTMRPYQAMENTGPHPPLRIATCGKYRFGLTR